MTANVRQRLADALYRLAWRIEPPDTRPPCPDCGTPGYADLEVDCPVCAEQRHEQMVQRESYFAGRADAAQEFACREGLL